MIAQSAVMEHVTSSKASLDTILNSGFDEFQAIDQDGLTFIRGQEMAKKAKKTAGKRAKVKKPAKKKVGAKKTYTIKAAKKSARAFVKAAGKRTSAAKKSGKKLVSRAIKAVADIAAPIIPGGENKT